jgi:hypothetical protein
MSLHPRPVRIGTGSDGGGTLVCAGDRPLAGPVRLSGRHEARGKPGSGSRGPARAG